MTEILVRERKFLKTEKKNSNFSKSRFQNFEKIDLIILANRSNRSNRKKSQKFIGQRINNFVYSFRVLMRIVTVQNLRLSRGNSFVKSPLQRTLTAQIMGRWTKHEGTLAHISLKRSIDMLALQCAKRFPARPADPNSSVFAELFPAL